MHLARVRVLCLDDDDRVLLFLVDDPAAPTPGEPQWRAPGDVVADGETAVAAAARVARQLLGLTIDEVDLGGVVAASSGDYPTSDGGRLRATDSFYVVTWPGGEVASGNIAWPEAKDHRWWTPDELDDTDEPVTPAGLADLIRRLGPDRQLEQPIRLLHRDSAS